MKKFTALMLVAICWIVGGVYATWTFADDANVDRFARYLKNFSKETQFICITHKKVTMEYADGLFGVTMPEKGVSSIVSVKLADVEDIED